MSSSNPLIQKWEEIYGRKEEPKKEDTMEEYLKNTLKTLSDPNIPLTRAPAVINPNSPITPIPYPVVSYDPDDLKASFLQVAGKLQTGDAHVSNMSLEINAHLALKKITFEVMVYEP